MLINKLRAVAEFHEAQERLSKADQAGFNRGINGDLYISPYEAIPSLCNDKEVQIDRFVAYYYDKGYLQGYSSFLKENPTVIENITYRRLAKRYRLLDNALKMGSIAFEKDHDISAEIFDVSELMPGTPDDIHQALYDIWELGYILGLHKERFLSPKPAEPWFDYDRAFVLVHAITQIKSALEEIDEERDPLSLSNEELLKIYKEHTDDNKPIDDEIPAKVLRAFFKAEDRFMATGKPELLECVVCPCHYWIVSDVPCDRHCYPAMQTIQELIGAYDKTLRAWLVR